MGLGLLWPRIRHGTDRLTPIAPIRFLFLGGFVVDLWGENSVNHVTFHMVVFSAIRLVAPQPMLFLHTGCNFNHLSFIVLLVDSAPSNE